ARPPDDDWRRASAQPVSPAVMTARLLSEETLREPLRRALESREPRRLPLGATTSAAVLVPLIEREGEVSVWLVRRPDGMRSHGGQVAFPGGKSDRSDTSLRITALREAEEELGINRSSVDVLGGLDDYMTVTGFTIAPWVGWLAAGVEIRPSASEVARAFTAPLRTFFEPASGVALPWQGWTVDGEHVWGATAAILRGLVSIVREFDGAQ
ncbi:MAG: NUDIX hydrolase, partial [Polyangiaceae bacterium]